MKKGLVFRILAAVLVMAVCIGCGDGGGDRMRMTVEGSGEVRFYLSGSGTATVDWGDGSDRTTREISRAGTRFSKTYAPGRYTITITGDDIIGLEIGRYEGWVAIGGELLTSLDVSRNTALEQLSVRNTPLTSLDVSRNTALTNLDVSNNQLTSLNVSGSTALRTLWVPGNQLISLDLSQNLELRELRASHNQLTSLVVSRYAIGLQTLWAANNRLSASALNALFESLPRVERQFFVIERNPGENEANRSIATAKGWVFATGGG